MYHHKIGFDKSIWDWFFFPHDGVNNERGRYALLTDEQYLMASTGMRSGPAVLLLTMCLTASSNSLWVSAEVGDRCPGIYDTCLKLSLIAVSNLILRHLIHRSTTSFTESRIFPFPSVEMFWGGGLGLPDQIFFNDWKDLTHVVCCIGIFHLCDGIVYPIFVVLYRRLLDGCLRQYGHNNVLTDKPNNVGGHNNVLRLSVITMIL